uniref:FYVE-type domain-containing protein n=2 Tax=Schistocephalus solidus TaxID=70667 RepID=A0A0V0JAG0_SCHSO
MSDVTEVQGFLCPECMLSLGSSEELMVHFNSKHASETDQKKPVERPPVTELPEVTELIKDYDQLVLGCFTQNKQLDEEVKRTSAKVTLLESVLRSLLEDTISTTTVANLEEDLRSKVTDFLERRTCAQTAQEAAFDQAVSDKNQALELVHLLEGKLADTAQSLATACESLQNANSRVLELEAQLQEQMQGQQQAQSLDPQLSMRMDGLQLDPVEADPSPKVWHLSRPPNSSRKNPPGQLDFEHKLSQLSEQLESSQKERNLLSEKVASLQNEVSKANNYLTEQAYNAQHLEQEKAQLQSALSAAESSTSALLAQHEKEILQLKSVSEENEKHLTGQLHHLQLQLKESSDELSRLRASIADLNSRNASSAAEVSQLANRLSEASSKLETSEASLASAMQEVGDLRQQLEIAKQTAQSSEYISESLRKEVAKLEGLLREQREETDGLNNQLDLLRSEKTALEEFKSKQTFEINDLKTEITRLLGCETSLKESLAQESSRLAQLEAECQKLRDAEGSALSGLQTKLDSTLLEHQTLMDQFIAVQDKNGQLEAALGTCHQELESLQRIVLDLGRQNQTLQIAQQRMTSRQWVADESASACSNCQREFSLSLRKHHCRRCGDVFCQTCSTKKATMPASKSPLRVCDACFTELTGSK